MSCNFHHCNKMFKKNLNKNHRPPIAFMDPLRVPGLPLHLTSWKINNLIVLETNNLVLIEMNLDLVI